MPCPSYTTRIMPKPKCRISDDFASRSPRQSETILQTKKCYLYRSMRHLELNTSRDTWLGRHSFAQPDQTWSCHRPQILLPVMVPHVRSSTGRKRLAPKSRKPLPPWDASVLLPYFCFCFCFVFVLCSLFLVLFFVLCFVLCALFFVLYSLYFVLCTLYFVLCALFFVLFFVFVLYFVLCFCFCFCFVFVYRFFSWESLFFPITPTFEPPKIKIISGQSIC